MPACPALLVLAGLSVAHAAPTVEEEALRAALEGREGEAVRLLERTGDPGLRWLAGRVALEAGDLAAAGRLLDAADVRSTWGRVDRDLADGAAARAAGVALAEMDRALGGAHRDAMASLLVGWAGERAATDPDNAARFLRAALGITPSARVRDDALDALFRLPPATSGEEALTDARRRALAEPGNVPARLRVAILLGETRPMAAGGMLRSLVGEGTPDDALAAARAMDTLPVPDAWTLEVLAKVAARRPGDEAVARVRLDHARRLARRDEATGTAALAALGADPVVGREARQAQAEATTYPAARRRLWLALAAAEGASAVGERARREAYDALVMGVRGAGDTRAVQAAAQAALREADGAGKPELLFLALPAGEGREAALWAHAAKFPEGEWCGELAERVLTGEARVDRELAEKLGAACPGDRGEAARLLRAHADADPDLVLRPSPGALAVYAAGTPEIRVSQHRIDPEALFRASPGNPLDARLDAWLLEPDAAWTVRGDGDTMLREVVRPRGAGLYALTVRAGDVRASALVVTDRLDVQGVARGESLAVAVLRGEAGVPGATLLVQDGRGEVHEARTGADGTVVLRDMTGPLRVLARKGAGLGYAAIDGGTGREAPEARWSIVAADRAAPLRGEVQEVTVFAALARGTPPATARLRSLDARGGEVQAVEVPLWNGVGAAQILVVGAGTLVVTDAGGDIARASVEAADRAARHDVRLAWSSHAPSAGGAVEARLWTVGHAGLEADLTVTTPWETTTRTVVLTGAPLRVPVDLALARPGEVVAVAVRPRSGGAVGGTVTVAAAGPEAPVLPARVAVGEALAGGVPSGEADWLRVSSGEVVRWVAPGEALRLPAPGTWEVARCGQRCGDGRLVEAVAPTAAEDASAKGDAGGEVDAGGVWHGAATLAALTAEDVRSARIVRDGEPVLSGGADLAGVREAWVTLGRDVPTVRVRPEPPPPLVVSGTVGGPLTLGAGLPAEARVWAWLRDASDLGPLRAHAVAPTGWVGAAGLTAPGWEPETVTGAAIEAALLAEEERLREESRLQRVDFGFSAADEVGGASGFGLGGGGYGQGAGGGVSHGYGARMGRASVTAPQGLAWEPHALAVYVGGPGTTTFAVPVGVTAADLEVVARLPDGRWLTTVARYDVPAADGSSESVTVPVAAGPEAPPRDATTGELLALAGALPEDAALCALAGLARAGVAGAEPAARAVAAIGEEGPGRVLAVAALAGGGAGLSGIAPPTGPSEASLPDARRAERAEAALWVAGVDPDRARAMVGRLLSTRDPGDGVVDPDPWIRVRAGLALAVAGAQDEALAVLAPGADGDDAARAAARAVITGRADPRFTDAWWSTARAPGAGALDRALAIRALALSLGRPDGASASGRGGPGGRGAAGGRAATVAALPLVAEPALAERLGERFHRRGIGSPPELPPATGAPAGRVVPLRVTVPAARLPTRLACLAEGAGAPSAGVDPWRDLPPSEAPRTIECKVTPTAPGDLGIVAAWHGPDGTLLGEGKVSLRVEAPRDSDLADPMSQGERLDLALRLAPSGDVRARRALQDLLDRAPLGAEAMAGASDALLAGARAAADPAALVAAFDAYREHVPDGSLDLDTAAAVAHAYADLARPDRAVAAARVVMDARFREELSAVSLLRGGGLELTALKLLRELVDRYPEGPTVVTARMLAPAMLLDRAAGDGDRLGYTRSSLRHTAAAELASFLLLHPDAPEAPDAAVSLAEALHALEDPERERALAGPLARRYRDAPAAWRLSLADARAQLAAGRAAVALGILDRLDPRPEVALERGRALEALGRTDDARAAFAASSTDEAGARLAWLDRSTVVVPPVVALGPGDPAVLPADLPRGTPVTVTAVRLQLESALLRDGGEVRPDALAVDGLRPAASRSFPVGADGDVPLPALPDGAYLLTVTVGARSDRLLLLRGDAQLAVEGYGGGTLVHATDRRGAPLPGAQLWFFAGGGTAGTARTDGSGSAWAPFGGGELDVLLRAGDRYAYQRATATGSPPAPSPMRQDAEPAYGEAARAYEALFDQAAEQKVQAAGL